MKYSETFMLSDLPATSRYLFNLNSIYDPNRTGIGHQPYGHDTFATMYNRYRVISCNWALNFHNPNSAIRVACIPSNEALAPANLNEVCENPRGQWKIQLPGGNTQQIKGRISIPSLVGRTKSQYMADDRYQATFGADPAELAILSIFHANLNDVAIIGTSCTITLTYFVEMFDIKHLPQS